MRRVALLVLCLLACTASAASAAAPAQVTIDDRSPALADAEGGGKTATLGFTNLTGEPLTLAAATATADPGCTLALAPAEVPPAEHVAVVLTTSAGCAISDDGIDFRVTPTSAGNALPAFEVTAAPKPEAMTQPDWHQLYAFAWVFGGSLVVALFLLILWNLPVGARHDVFERLPGLQAPWDFKESWANNVVAIAGLLSGLLASSEVVKAATGEDAEDALALATVGAALSLALITAAPLVLITLRSRKPEAFTAGGVILAAVLTLTGAIGQLWIVFKSGQQLELGGVQDHLTVPFAAVFGLLVIYSGRTLWSILLAEETGTAKVESARVVDALDSLFAESPTTEAVKMPLDDDARRVIDQVTTLELELPARRRRAALL